jgi:phage tail protein X
MVWQARNLQMRWEDEVNEYRQRKYDSLDALAFMMWLMLAATVVAAVREMVFG